MLFIVFKRLEGFECSTFQGGRGSEQPGGEGGEGFQDLRRGEGTKAEISPPFDFLDAHFDLLIHRIYSFERLIIYSAHERGRLSHSLTLLAMTLLLPLLAYLIFTHFAADFVKCVNSQNHPLFKAKCRLQGTF